MGLNISELPELTSSYYNSLDDVIPIQTNLPLAIKIKNYHFSKYIKIYQIIYQIKIKIVF